MQMQLHCGHWGNRNNVFVTEEFKFESSKQDQFVPTNNRLKVLEKKN